MRRQKSTKSLTCDGLLVLLRRGLVWRNHLSSEVPVEVVEFVEDSSKEISEINSSEDESFSEGKDTSGECNDELFRRDNEGVVESTEGIR